MGERLPLCTFLCQQCDPIVQQTRKIVFRPYQRQIQRLILLFLKPLIPRHLEHAFDQISPECNNRFSVLYPNEFLGDHNQCHYQLVSEPLFNPVLVKIVNNDVERFLSI